MNLSSNQLKIGMACLPLQEIAKLNQLKVWLAPKKIETCELSPSDVNFAIIMLSKKELDESNLKWLQQLISNSCHLILIDIGDTSLPFYKVAELLAIGVSDIIPWKYQEQLAELIQLRIYRHRIIEKILNSDRIKKHLFGSCSKWKEILRKVIEIACFSKAPVLILGESGTGKELIARLIHDLDRRPTKAELILLDCSTLVPDLFGSEFFGHEKGSYTNAISSRDGAFALADQGTLFLDEIGELPLSLQAALLRVIQEGHYKKLGSNEWKKSHFRLISATNRKLEESIDQNTFRADLFFRISTCIIRLPTLQERALDIPELVNKFLAKELNIPEAPIMDKLLLHYLMTRKYPGNIRELKQIISRIAYRYTGEGPITLGCLPFDHQLEAMSMQPIPREKSFAEAIRNALANGQGLKDIKRMAGNLAMDIAIEEAEGNLQLAAKRLEVSDRTLQVYKASG